MADALNPDALHHELSRLPGWTGDTSGIERDFECGDFAGSIEFVNRLADHAEGAGHHPDLRISWDTVKVTYVTHDVGGVTQADIEQARQVTDLSPASADPDEVPLKPTGSVPGDQSPDTGANQNM